MQDERRVGIVSAHVAEELFVLLGRDCRFRPRPQGARRVDLPRRLLIDLQHDRMRDMVGIGRDDPFQPGAVEKFFRVLL